MPSAFPCRPLANGQTHPSRPTGREGCVSGCCISGCVPRCARNPGCVFRGAVCCCARWDAMCRGVVYVPGCRDSGCCIPDCCIPGHAIRAVTLGAAPGTLQAVLLVGRTRFDRLAFEGFARLEVVGHPDREAAVVPLLFDVDHAHEPVAVRGEGFTCSPNVCPFPETVAGGPAECEMASVRRLVSVRSLSLDAHAHRLPVTVLSGGGAG